MTFDQWRNVDRSRRHLFLGSLLRSEFEEEQGQWEVKSSIIHCKLQHGDMSRFRLRPQPQG